MQIIFVYAIAVIAVLQCKCHPSGEKETPDDNQTGYNLGSYLGRFFPVSRQKVNSNDAIESKDESPPYIDIETFGKTVGGIIARNTPQLPLEAMQVNVVPKDPALLVETPETATSALKEGYDRRFLVFAALEHDRIETVKHLISPPDSKEETWAAAEIQWLKSDTKICDTARSASAVQLLVGSNFGCPFERILRAIKEDDTDTFNYLLPEISLDDHEIEELWRAASDYSCNLEILKSLATKESPKLISAKNKDAPRWISARICRQAANTGTIEILDWMHKISPCDHDVYDEAIENGRFDVINWAAWHEIEFVKKPSVYRNVRSNFEVLIWAKGRGALLGNFCIDAAKGNNLEILQWAKREEYPCSSDPAIIYEAKINGHERIVKWALENGIPVELSFLDTFNLMKAGNLSLLQWYYMESKELYWLSLHEAFEQGHLHILEWASSVGISYRPNNLILLNAAEKGNLNSLKWAYQQDRSLMDPDKLHRFALTGCIDIVKWVWETSKRYFTSFFNLVLTNSITTTQTCPKKQETDEVAFLEWATAEGGYINDFPQAVEKASPAALRWIIEHASGIDDKTITTLAKEGNLQMLKLAAFKTPKKIPMKSACEGAISQERFAVLSWLISQDGGDECFDIAKNSDGIVNVWAKFNAYATKVDESDASEMKVI